ncbi:sortilin-related receptor-like [Elgaria multicarinata webbii]|uniref:sortilin-related receptor-like n=1 Tax=Elgaria multicarinata webbii TaxID=159646 RepID=UPI002FCCC573
MQRLLLLSLLLTAKAQPDCGDDHGKRGCHDGNISCGRRGRLCAGGGPCLPWERFCDGHPDCPDGSDESAPACPHPPALPQPTCGKDAFRCAPDTACFTLAWVCDGHADCLDGRDEWGCNSDLPLVPSVLPKANHTDGTSTPEINYDTETVMPENLLTTLFNGTVAPEINYEKGTVMSEILLTTLFMLMAFAAVVVTVTCFHFKTKLFLADFKLDKATQQLMLEEASLPSQEGASRCYEV